MYSASASAYVNSHEEETSAHILMLPNALVCVSHGALPGVYAARFVKHAFIMWEDNGARAEQVMRNHPSNTADAV